MLKGVEIASRLHPNSFARIKARGSFDVPQNEVIQSCQVRKDMNLGFLISHHTISKLGGVTRAKQLVFSSTLSFMYSISNSMIINANIFKEPK